MYKEIEAGIAGVLHEAYPDAAIYTENIRQGLEAPAFLITSVSLSREKIIGMIRYDCTYAVQYFPENKLAEKAELMEAQDRLDVLLRRIPVKFDEKEVKQVFRQEEPGEAAVLDGVLTYTLRLIGYFIDPAEYEKMEQLEPASFTITEALSGSKKNEEDHSA